MGLIKSRNLSLTELEKLERMNNLSLNALVKMAMARHIKRHKDMSREDLLIALLKSNHSHTKLLKINDSNTETGETKRIFNHLRNNFSREEIQKHREKFHKKEQVYNNLKEIKQKDSLTTKEKRVLKNITKYFKKLKEDLNKIKTYQYNITHNIGYLFNEITKEDCYEPTEIKNAFDDNYIELQSKGDNNDNLSLEE